MALPSEDRVKIGHKLAELFAQGRPVTLTKPQFQAAVAGIDDFLDANANAMNQAIPQPARAELSNAEKAALFSFVAMKRWGG